MLARGRTSAPQGLIPLTTAGRRADSGACVDGDTGATSINRNTAMCGFTFPRRMIVLTPCNQLDRPQIYQAPCMRRCLSGSDIAFASSGLAREGARLSCGVNNETTPTG